MDAHVLLQNMWSSAAAHLSDAGNADSVVADGADDAGHVGAVAVAVQNVRARRVRVEVCAVNVVHNACTPS